VSSNFVPLDSIFLSKVIERNTNEDGSEKDPRLLARMQNPICVKCHEDYKKKYPNQPFNVKCKGVYDEVDYQEIQAKATAEDPDTTITIDEIREFYDVTFWAERYILYKDDSGDLKPFKARFYQNEVLRCTANRKVDRMGRGLGKTIIGVIEELHKAITTKKYEIMVVCPAQSQSEKWFQEIKFQLENSPYLRDSLAQRKQQPYHLFRFYNGSTISIFTAGSKSGRGADAVRGQDPRRVRLDEQDYLVDKDYQAIMPLVRRHKNSEFHGASTPSGLRGMFWEMCTRNSEYREFYFPISVHPSFSPEYEQSCIREAKTMDRYRHEFLAEFGDPEAGVFKSIFVDAAKKTLFADRENHPYVYRQLAWDASKKYMMGIDWNGAGTGTKLRVVEYDPDTHKRRVVAKRSVDEPGSTMRMSMDAIRDMNRFWHCEEIFIDYGFGNGQDEMIRAMGIGSEHPADATLRKVKVIDFGATTEFNKLVSARLNSHYTNIEENKFERRTKPFMVDGMVMAIESGLFEFSGVVNEDELLEEQLRAYRVKNYSQHGYANTYEAPAVGDHDLDATMLAMLAVEMRYGLFQTEDTIRRLAQILHVGGWGIPNFSPNTGSIVQNPMDSKREQAGVPNRSSTQGDQATWRINYLMRNGAYVSPVRSSQSRQGNRPPSRTDVFRKKPPGRPGDPKRFPL
jgi:hypothetical protein